MFSASQLAQLALLQRAYGLATVSLLFWFFNNVTTVILNKIIYERYGFRYPLTLTAIHMFICSLGAFLVLRVLNLVQFQPIASNYFWQRIFPLSFIFILNIVMGNISLNFIPVSFMQTVKSSVPAFTVLMETFFLRKRHGTLVYFSLIPIVGGIMFATWTEVNFELIGFSTAVMGSICTALQTIISSMVMTQRLNAVNLTYYMAPPSFLMMVPLCYYFEYYELISKWEGLNQTNSLLILVLSGAIAFLLNISTFYAIANTSPLTFTIAGNFKVILSIVFSVMIFKNKITLLNACGCAVALIGVAWYNQIKYEENMRNAAEKQQQAEAEKNKESQATNANLNNTGSSKEEEKNEQV